MQSVVPSHSLHKTVDMMQEAQMSSVDRQVVLFNATNLLSLMISFLSVPHSELVLGREGGSFNLVFKSSFFSDAR